MENICITSKTGEVLHNSTSIAGVEDPQDFDDPDYETEDEEEDELDHSSQGENSQQGHKQVDTNKVCEDVHNEDPIQLDAGTAPVQAEAKAEAEEQQE